ncbi:hypothetical protein [Streptacidiphilus sp. P02-A3a]|uniref:hypothetical protein n=1 Tax=Streptacidiphilus sp. P02-A3a TaxID=2704468 RepID=UPI0015F87034|nr:hypothetical protein [Streptacidiphilus sp. P02-A3a]QMU67186.1 hypothetical protein GXP74_02140 [Streptacidiphilus sp. P02-A3a]
MSTELHHNAPSLETGSATALLRFATAGAVDDGKSTLVGRLLHDSKSFLPDQLQAVTDASNKRGQEAPDLALQVPQHVRRRSLGGLVNKCHTTT